MSPHSLSSVLDLRFTEIYDLGLIQHSNQSTQTMYHHSPHKRVVVLEHRKRMIQEKKECNIQPKDFHMATIS